MSVLPLVAAGVVAVLGGVWSFRAYPVAALNGREAQLAEAKRGAALLLVGVAACFLATFAFPPMWITGMLRTGFEAAMVGAVADWIAVSALFRRIWLVEESDVIARQKDTIADELARFVHDKFLDAESLVTLIRKHDLGQVATGWLTEESNRQHLAGMLLKLFGGVLHMVEADRVQQLLKDATRTLLGDVDLSKRVAQVLEALTAGGHHRELLEQLILKMLAACNQRETREAIARKIVHWLRTEHRIKQMVLPTELIGRKGAEIIADNLGDYLREVQADNGHALRASFDQMVQELIVRLQSDPQMQHRVDDIRDYLLNDEHLARYASGLWTMLSEWIKRDLERSDSVLHRNIVAAAAWLGREMATDPELRRTLNAQMEAIARGAAPEAADFLTRHIRETVQAWDRREMSHQVELALGARLQKIRLNGTAMGFVIGVLLFLVGLGAEHWLARV